MTPYPVRNRIPPMAPWFWVTLAVVLLDHLSKYEMSRLLPLCAVGRCESIDVLPVFRLVLLHNQGAAFSFLSDAGGWQRWFLVGVSSLVSLFVAAWILRLGDNERWLAASLSLILGGAIGNLIDRVSQGYVVDFLLVHYGDAFFPAFNLADSAITIGAGLMIIDSLIIKKAEDGDVEEPK